MTTKKPDILMDISPCKSFAVPTEIGIDWEAIFDRDDTRQLEELQKKGHLLSLDCYIHGGYWFSLRGEGMQCRFDTATAIGFLFVKKTKYPEEEVAKEAAREYLSEYNDEINGFNREADDEYYPNDDD